MRQDSYLKSLISQHCCDSENDDLNTRVNGSIAIVRTTESLLRSRASLGGAHSTKNYQNIPELM